MQVSHLGAAAQKFQSAIQNTSSNLSTPELQNNCNMYVLLNIDVSQTNTYLFASTCAKSLSVICWDFVYWKMKTFQGFFPSMFGSS